MHGGPSQLTAGVHEGDVIAGKYRVDKILGVGGMGVVVSARHIQLDEKVALKFLHPEALGDAEAVARFIQEARAAVKIKSEHVARVSDVGTLENGAPYMVMEYLEGGDLAAWIKQRGPLPIEQAVDFVLQACVAVADAHALGIIHRDLKPANLFCIRRSDGQFLIKVLDFGISKLTDLTGTGPGMGMTKTSALMGSPLYMSPEQMRSSRDVDAGTDIWALGVILFELMAGRPAFLAGSVTELAIKVANEAPPALRSFRPDMLPGLEAVVSRCLEKDRRQRYRNVGELALALWPFAPPRARHSVERISGILQSGGFSGTAMAVGPSSAGGSTLSSSGTLPAMGRTTVGGGRGRSAVIGVGVVGALAAVAVAALVQLPRRGLNPLASPAIESPSTATAVLPPAAAPAASPVGVPPAALPAVAILPKLAEPEPAESAAGATPQTFPVASAAPRRSPTKPAVGPAPAVATATRPAASATAPPAASAKPPVNCDPPYYFDARGNRSFKPECL
jgi:serine/threonine protein kinase